MLANGLLRAAYVALLIAVLMFGSALLYWVCIFLPPVLSLAAVLGLRGRPARTATNAG